MTKIMTEEKTEALALRWLQKATRNSSDQHDPLTGIYCDGELAVSADGYRLHKGPKPRPLTDYEDQIIKVRDGKTLHKTPGRVYDTEEVEGNYPDYKQIDPAEEGREKKLEIAVNAEYLREALEVPNEDAPGNRVVLTFYEWGEDYRGRKDWGPFTVESDDREYKAVIMPMHKD